MRTLLKLWNIPFGRRPVAAHSFYIRYIIIIPNNAALVKRNIRKKQTFCHTLRLGVHNIQLSAAADAEKSPPQDVCKGDNIRVTPRIPADL